jgi:hypothetical protein
MQKFPLLKVFEISHYLGLVSHVLPWILMLTMTLITKHFMGKGMSLQFTNVTGVTHELIQGVGAFNVAKELTKGVI